MNPFIAIQLHDGPANNPTRGLRAEASEREITELSCAVHPARNFGRKLVGLGGLHQPYTPAFHSER